MGSITDYVDVDRRLEYDEEPSLIHDGNIKLQNIPVVDTIEDNQ